MKKVHKYQLIDQIINSLIVCIKVIRSGWSQWGDGLDKENLYIAVNVNKYSVLFLLRECSN